MEFVGDFVATYLVPEFLKNIAQGILEWIWVALLFVFFGLVAIWDWFKNLLGFGGNGSTERDPEEVIHRPFYAFVLKSDGEVEHYCYGWSGAVQGRLNIMNANPLGMIWKVYGQYEDPSQQLFNLAVNRALQMPDALVKKMPDGLYLITHPAGDQPMRSAASELGIDERAMDI